jgi:hypothetical protein
MVSASASLNIVLNSLVKHSYYLDTYLQELQFILNNLSVKLRNFCRFVTNRWMVRPACRDQDVEWGYAFDVHLNAFFPVLFILHVVLLLVYHSENFSLTAIYSDTY